MSTTLASSHESVKEQSWFASGTAFVWYIAGSLTLLHLLTANRYGYFGDELYYMACGEHLSSSFGWEELVTRVAQAYYSVPAGERGDVAIFANDFAAAGAIDLMGGRYGLPKAISGHQSYWLWGPRSYSGQTVIVVGSTQEGASRWFNEVTVIVELHHPYAAPWENRPVLLCRGPKRFHSLAEGWPQLKNWN